MSTRILGKNAANMLNLATFGLAPVGSDDSTVRRCPMEPVYSPENTKAAYQLNWSVALFGSKEVPSSTDRLPLLKSTIDLVNES